jgi:molybdopterin synthase catalytic subunit
MSVRVQAAPFDPNAELSRLQDARAGALASFVGYVRGEAGAVGALVLDHYPGFTEKEIARIEAAARARFALFDVLIIHRFGRLAPGEAIVLAAALAAHRKPALEAVDFIMDCLKTDAPFWKREAGAGGERWIEPRAQDRAARAQWDEG